MESKKEQDEKIQKAPTLKVKRYERCPYCKGTGGPVNIAIGFEPTSKPTTSDKP